MAGEDRPVNIQAIEALVQANTEANDNLRNLVEGVHRDAELRDRKVKLLEEDQLQTRRLLTMVAIMLALLVVVGVINAASIQQARRNAEVTAATAKDAQRTYALLLGCLDVTSECGKRNRETTQRALDEIKLYELTALYCVRTNPLSVDPDGDKFVACINRMYPGGPKLVDR